VEGVGEAGGAHTAHQDTSYTSSYGHLEAGCHLPATSYSYTGDIAPHLLFMLTTTLLLLA